MSHKLPRAVIPPELKKPFIALSDKKRTVCHYLDYIVKLNSKGKEKKRVAVITHDSFIVCLPTGEIKRTLKVSGISEILVDKADSSIALRYPQECDLLFRTPQYAKIHHILEVLHQDLCKEAVKNADLTPEAMQNLQLSRPDGAPKEAEFRPLSKEAVEQREKMKHWALLNQRMQTVSKLKAMGRPQPETGGAQPPRPEGGYEHSDGRSTGDSATPRGANGDDTPRGDPSPSQIVDRSVEKQVPQGNPSQENDVIKEVGKRLSDGSTPNSTPRTSTPTSLPTSAQSSPQTIMADEKQAHAKHVEAEAPSIRVSTTQLAPVTATGSNASTPGFLGVVQALTSKKRPPQTAPPQSTSPAIPEVPPQEKEKPSPTATHQRPVIPELRLPKVVTDIPAAVPSKAPEAEVPPASQRKTHVTHAPPAEVLTRQVRAKFAYSPSNPDEIEFQAGDAIEIIREETGIAGWWLGLNPRTQSTGLVPSNFLEGGPEAPPPPPGFPQPSATFQNIGGSSMENLLQQQQYLQQMVQQMWVQQQVQMQQQHQQQQILNYLQGRLRQYDQWQQSQLTQVQRCFSQLQNFQLFLQNANSNLQQQQNLIDGLYRQMQYSKYSLPPREEMNGVERSSGDWGLFGGLPSGGAAQVPPTGGGNSARHSTGSRYMPFMPAMSEKSGQPQ
eukprot:TRINITY_DN30619_c0_g1_i1.p1 TRINITY_DN30619_c0_g1~~TRINITY_DN30619_c0_g1_i1.p1  ORF type:complete len:669 (-),score=92.72 TRINITY_DN30619_c0_g1_i1:131-2137(-)